MILGGHISLPTLFHCYLSMSASQPKHVPDSVESSSSEEEEEKEEEEEEGSDTHSEEEQEDPEDYCKGTYPSIVPVCLGVWACGTAPYSPLSRWQEATTRSTLVKSSSGATESFAAGLGPLQHRVVVLGPTGGPLCGRQGCQVRPPLHGDSPG